MASAIFSVGLSLEVAAATSLKFDAEDANNGRPVTKVVNLLKDMLEQMEKEAEEDEEMYNKQACFCDSNEKEKTKSIADAETRIYDLTTSIEELTALSAQLTTEIKNLDQEVAKNQNALDEATAMRQKELAEFVAEEKDLLGSIGAIKSAITVMKKHNSASFMQTGMSQKQIVAAKIGHVMSKHSDMLKHQLTHSQKRIITAFIQSPEDGVTSSGPSSEIFGIMSQMKETFETNLAEAQKEEADSLKKYEELKAAKEDEINDGKTMGEQKTQELATTDEKHAQAVEDLADTKKTLESDEKFLADLKEQCAMQDAEFEERTKTRQLEMEACSKVQAMLTSDEAHDLFSKTLGFVQTKSTSHSKIRSEASRVLMNAAQKFKSPRLSELAYSAKKDAFAAVKKNIDVLIADLWATQKEEVKQKDFCTEEFNTNQAQTEKKDREKEDVDAEIEDYKSTLKELNTVISGLKAEIAEMKEQLKRAGEDREIENKEFQMTVADQRASQKLLGRALQVLKGFYEKKAAAFVEEGDNDEQPAGFKKYKKNEAGGGVMAMIAGIVNAAKAMEAEAIRAEQDSQAGYEAFVKDTNGVLEAKEKDLVNKSEEKGKVEAEKVEADGTMESIVTELEGLAAYKAELHGKCDFLLKNFELRQSSRVEEVEALKQAKAILSGAKFDSFVQTTMKLQQ
eukprot:gnl/TRDRNA2_/TRDRNA2_175977_c3_seq10.p1 gnl/TRDRNA2_/TRDRNA2_175977_c3~~gnl/TRDRNA2_/TRDRNA2_175977_c3_seq10.p1  ORF type:complete len:719 (+),score=291.22 gnl/TRDRNA2_/TRDRNA2_175977_c3_seq10:116-2158(+)